MAAIPSGTFNTRVLTSENEPLEEFLEDQLDHPSDLPLKNPSKVYTETSPKSLSLNSAGIAALLDYFLREKQDK